MLGKLLKYEFRATAPFMALLTVGLLGSAGLARLFEFLSETFNSPFLSSAVVTLITIVYIIFAAASQILVAAMLIYRFGTNMFGGAGYLTLTLPVRRTTHLTAKLIIGIFCELASLIVLLGSLCILFSSRLDVVFNEVLPIFDNGIVFTAKLFGVSYPLMVIFICVSCFIGLMQNILTLYCSVAIGQLFTGHVVLGSFIGYVAIGALTKTASNLLGFTMGLGGELEKVLASVLGYNVAIAPSSGFGIYLIISLVMSLVMTVILYLVTCLILKRAVNLQ